MYSIKKAALKNFTKFTGKRLCFSLFVKLQTFSPASLLKSDSNTGIFLLRNFEKHLLTAVSELTLQSD